MKINLSLVVACVLLILGAVGYRAKFQAKPVLAAQPHEVLIFGCQINPHGDEFTSEGSSGTTVTATTCSQALADALNEGFQIQSVTPSFLGDNGNTYTLVRGR